MKRKRLIKAAKEINKIMVPKEPINVDKSDKKLIKKIKEAGPIIVHGGPNPDVFSEKTIEVFKFFDAWNPPKTEMRPEKKPEKEKVPENAVKLKDLYAIVEGCKKKKDLKKIVKGFATAFTTIDVTTFDDAAKLKDSMFDILDDLPKETYIVPEEEVTENVTENVTEKDDLPAEQPEETKAQDPPVEKPTGPSAYTVAMAHVCKNAESLEMDTDDLCALMEEDFDMEKKKSSIRSSRIAVRKVVAQLRANGCELVWS